MDKFLFGSASSSQQVEGGNIHNQIYELEQCGVIPPTGLAADFLHNYKTDIEIAKSLGMNAMRVSLEWSRLMPRSGEWNREAVAYYRDLFLTMQQNGITPMVTLFHWTVPSWVYQKGFNSKFLLEQFEKFVELAVKEFGSQVKLWLIINEPEVFAFEINLLGDKRSKVRKIVPSLRTYWQLIRMHRRGYKIIKAIDPSAQVGIAKNVAYHESFRQNHILDKLLVWAANLFGNELFVKLINSKLDFIGLNYYFYHSLKFSWRSLFERKNKQTIKSDMGEKTYPKGLYFLLEQFWKFKKTLFITENGIANSWDEMRIRFIEEHLEAVREAHQQGIDVRGYFYWSLTDTYEWKDGFDRKFGLVEVDHQTGQRRLRLEFDKERLSQILQRLN